MFLIFLSGKPRDFFLIHVDFQSKYFREVKQIQAYCFQTLIGNVGGYIGLFVGYTIKEIPTLLKMVYDRVKKI